MDRAKRRIWVAGSIRPAAPKVFDALVYLIENRDRVVTKVELIDRIWGGRPVTDSAVSRTVMKARRAIDDEHRTPAGIATVHRIGYRFDMRVELVSIHADPRHRGDADVPAASSFKRLVLQPFEGPAEDWRFGWIRFGMPALLCHILSGERRLRAHAVSSEVNPAADPFDGEEAVTHRCDAEVSVEGQAFLLQYRLVSQGREHLGTLRARELNLLAHELGRAIVVHLFGSGG